MHMRILVLLLLLASSNTLATDLPPIHIPDTHAFKSWVKKPYDIDEIDFATIKTKLLACDDKKLIPLSADQATKKYHRYIVGTYNHAKLRGNSEACATASPTNYCLRPDTIEYVIMSDTFADSCGNKYRGFWEILFFTRHENMGTLSSLGRTFYEKPNSQFPGEFETGPTYLVEEKSFLFFSELFASDSKN